jgi:hypothetical protein
MPYVHLAARSTPKLAPFESLNAATWTWNRLRELFPTAVSAVLMPNHVQLLVDTDDIAEARKGFARTLGHLQRWWAPGCAVWERVRMPVVFAPGGPLARQDRYIVLNAPRAKLCSDPLAWPWSTARDVMGAVADPWIDIDRLARALRVPSQGFRERWFRYVSGDKSVAVAGAPAPRGAPPSTVPREPLHRILCAAGAALRIPAPLVHTVSAARRLFIALARRQGWTDDTQLAAIVAMTPRGVRNPVQVDARALEAAALCLGDERLWAPFEREEPVASRGERVPDWELPDAAGFR